MNKDHIVISCAPCLSQERFLEIMKGFREYDFINMDSANPEYRGPGRVFLHNKYIDEINERLAKQIQHGRPYFLIVSTHKKVRDALASRGQPYWLVWPDESMKEDWLRTVADKKGQGVSDKFRDNWNKWYADAQGDPCETVDRGGKKFLKKEENFFEHVWKLTPPRTTYGQGA